MCYFVKLCECVKNTLVILTILYYRGGDVLRAPTEFKKIVGARIKALRKRAGMTQLELADHLGYNSTGMISHVEKGISGMDKDKLLECAKLFNVHPAILMSDESFTNEDVLFLADISKMCAEKKGTKYMDAIKNLVKLALAE